jgi:hypothetical protein
MSYATRENDHKPVLMIVVGRQRVGKTTFLNGLCQYLQAHAAVFEIWDADKMNATHNMAGFHEEALQPASTDPEDVKAWLEDRFADRRATVRRGSRCWRWRDAACAPCRGSADRDDTRR